MGNLFGSKSKKTQKKPKDAFERGKIEVQKLIEEINNNADPKNKRTGRLVPSSVIGKTPPEYITGPCTRTSPSDPCTSNTSSSPWTFAEPSSSWTPTAPSAPVLSYDDVALADMRHQLNNDANAFLLNNILLSVQFYENYEREMQQLNNKPRKKEKLINDAMIRYNKHVFFDNRLQKCVSQHVSYQRSQGQMEAIAPRRLYVIYDNIEARETGDNSDYSAALDVPFYKLEIEDCKESGYVMLKKLEVLESTLNKEKIISNTKEATDDSIYADSGNEFNVADDTIFTSEYFSPVMTKLINNKLDKNDNIENINLGHLENIQSSSAEVITENIIVNQCRSVLDNVNEEEAKPKKSILKNARQFSSTSRYIKMQNHRSYGQDNNKSNESEYVSSGYESILSGSSTVTESAIPKRIHLNTSDASSFGVLSNEYWTEKIKKNDDISDDEDETTSDSLSKYINSDNLSDEDDERMIDSAYKTISRTSLLYRRYYYLNSLKFMNNFIVNFKQHLGSGLEFSQNDITNAMTHGATIYCDSFKDFVKINNEIIPALTAKWPNAANQWIIRERKIIQNPRNNFKYQWPVPNMVDKVRYLTCLLVPLGYQFNKEPHPDQKIQWRITFPEAESYLESTLAHSHIRCYLFTLILHKTFMEKGMMIGIDASHIKNHLFWQCEDNFAKWPEDRLGKSLISFLESLYKRFRKSTLPNYFMERCNEFESIPASVRSLLQWKLKDILENPVMHMLYAIDKLKYNSIGFYPTFDCQRLYEVLTCKNPLHRSNPNLPGVNYGKKSRNQRKEIKTNIKLPQKMEIERQPLVLKLFIQHFIAMARSSEKFDAINQAMIYLEQAQRLSLLLLDTPGGDTIADEYLDVIRDKLSDCHLKKVNQGGFKVPHRKEDTEQSIQNSTKQHPKPEQTNLEAVTEAQGIPAITVSDIHLEQLQHKHFVRELSENSTVTVTVADIHKEYRQKDKSTTKEHANSIGNIAIHEEQNKKNSITAEYKISKSPSIDKHMAQYQRKGSITENHGSSTIAYSDSHFKEQQIQLDDSVIEESYL